MDQLDIRIPLGLLLLVLGFILVVYGLLADPRIYVTHSLGQNVNAIWGTVFVLSGVLVLWLAKRSPRR